MNRIATIVLASVVGLHCGNEAIDSSSLEETADQNAEVTEATEQKAAPKADTGNDVEEAPADPGFETFIGSRRATILSRVTGPDGATYIAGVFSGATVMGDEVLKSRGKDDVFIARVEPDGHTAWAKSIGSRQMESAPRVTFTEGRVKLMAMAGGEVDCGSGPLAWWSSEMFFLCTYDPDGTPVHGALFPTGRQ